MNHPLAILLCGLAAFTAQACDHASCFIPGEVIEYKIDWLGVPLAWSTTTTDTVTEEGRELIRIRMVTQTFGAYEYIFKVDDATEVVIDPETALPLRHDLIINEGSIHKSELTTFYHDQKVAIFQDRISKDFREIPIESDTQEIFSFIYSNRNADLEELASRKYKLLVSGKIYELGMEIRNEDDIDLPHYGKVPSIEIEPIAEFDGFFIRQGKIFFWVSKEPRRIVTCIKSKVAVGRVTAKLEQVSGPGNGFWDNNK